jgi:hypothetical protein
MKTILPLRKDFAKSRELSARKQIAKAEFDAWFAYLQSRKDDLPKPDYEIDEKELSMLKENFDRFKVT